MKTPFTYDDLWGLIYDANRAEVAACHSNKQDAAFIVRACNAHDDLVAAMERLIYEFDTFTNNRPDSDKLGDTSGMSNARAALAKAKGGA